MSEVETVSGKPLWLKVWQFPLVAMAVALALMVATLAGTQQLFTVLPEIENAALDMIVRTVVGVGLVFVVYKLFVTRLGARKKDDLPARGSITDTLLGLLVGAAIFTAVVGVAAIVGAYRILGWGSTQDLLQIVLLTGVVAGFVEEVIIRGIVFRWLEEFGGSLLALAISAALFGFLHIQNDNATVWSSVAIALEAGILLGGAYMLTRNLWLAIGIHAGWNVTQGFVWGVPVSGNPFMGMVESGLYGPDWLSGGAFGLEASVIALVIATGAGIWMVWQARKEGHWISSMWSRK
ncbi:CPBP family intramembrane glutamic endopeptidase [Pontixanthobacter aquaemixtae]|uniref:CPBP family intramembrane metalloprotease n=1 Tax=Pontixanthobacter aquaemixtae TaxID=1958940 RepID=A0A844ZSA8_9SPHN|nr:type II CAAX endopeptidase family protein [Pontixanthobacter aquaemixtae]MXO90743.1 CPBP family intramembrane metalloprotease [Pontixanthobacter aquaemixtae]